ncbi:hypothetical protein [[Phormidium] sp. LEGE 05292]|uniref:hypothetical protein n=1 Tax=[Phormidium] sp. LEGE 05292 TaxID=767427 RepID=UPI001D135C1C|nr:hypothetical protein [Phormidium sp. LEGE 05292]
MMQETKEYEQLTPKAGKIILEQLPDRIKNAIVARAVEIDYPVEAVIEMAIAGYLDPHAIGFVDCKPDRKA